MRYLRYNTAVIVTVGPFYDKTDGVTIETALTITNERITFTTDSDAGSAPTLVLDNVTGATSGTSNDLNYITNNDAGLMQIELSAANTSYLGRAFLSITDAANHCPVFHEFTILPQQVYDSLIAGTDLLDANASQVGGTSQTGRDLGASVLLSSGTGTGQLSLSSGAVLLQATQTGVTIPTVTTLTNLPAVTTNWLTAAGLATDAVTEITNAILAAGDVDGYTLEQAFKLMLAALAGKLSGAATTTVTIRSADDSADRVTATVDASGNRSAVTLNAAG